MKFTDKDQFLMHTKKHVENVSDMTSVMFDMMLEDPELCEKYSLSKDVDYTSFKEKVSKISRSHDYAKLEDSELFLNRHSLERPFYDFLFERTGKVLDAEERNTIQRMNELDDLTTTILMKKAGMNMSERTLYRFIEHTSDIVERGMNPLTKFEFGREIDKASDYKRGYTEDSEIRLMVKLEKHYEENILDDQLVFLEDLKKSSKKENKIESKSDFDDVIEMLKAEVDIGHNPEQNKTKFSKRTGLRA